MFESGFFSVFRAPAELPVRAQRALLDQHAVNLRIVSCPRFHTAARPCVRS